MTRKIFAALLGAVLVTTVLAAPAAAADRVRNVWGHDLAAADLVQFQDRCSAFADTTPTPDPFLRKGGTRGTHAIGWQYAEADWEVGPLAAVLSPTTLTGLTVDVLSPGGATTGHYYAIYYDNTAGYTEGYWIGYRSLDHQGDGWRRHDLADSTLTWTYFEPGYSEAGGSATLADLATQRGGDGRGAYVGAAFGCDADLFYLDRLRVTTGAEGTTLYDFEGLRTTSHMEWSTDGKTVRNRKSLTITHGQKFWMLGHSDGVPVGGGFRGKGILAGKPHGRSKYFAYAKGEFLPNRYVGFRGTVPHRTVFRFVSLGTQIFEPSVSERITVQVRAVVDARVVDRRLVEGQRLLVQGRIEPGNKGTRVSLERRLNGRWVTLDRGRTGRKGAFDLAVVARTPGKWTVRVEVSAGKGNLGTRSRAVDVTVEKRVAPQPPPPDPTPEPDHIDPPPPPPPPGPTMPDPEYRWAPRTTPVLSPAPAPECTLPGPYAVVPCAPGDAD